MRSIFTLVRKRGSSSFEVALGPESSPREHRSLVKRLRFERADSAYDEVIVASGIRKHRLSKIEPKPKPAPVKAKPKTIVQKAGGLAKRFIGI